MDKSNLLTPTQMAGMATSKPTSPAVPGNPATPIIPSNGLLTPTQMAQMAQHQDPANPTGAVGSSWDAFDKAKGTSTNGGVINSLKTSLGEAKNEITGTGVNQGENPIQRGVELAATATGAIPKAVAQLPVIKPVVDAINGVSADAINWIADKIGSIKAAQDFVMNHPEAAKNLENVAKTTGALADTTGNLALIQGGINALKKPDVTKAINTVDRHIAEAQDVITENTANPSETFNQLGGEKGLIESVKTNIADGLKAEGHVQAADAIRGLDTTKVNSLNDFSTLAKDTIKEANLSPLAGAVKPFAENVTTKATDLASTIKEKISPTPTIDEIVGKVAQGDKSEIPTFTKGLENIGDTSKIKTYSDLNTASTKTIADLAKAQDANLAKETATHPISEFEQVTGKGSNAIKTNYVQQALDQLNEYYTKTNDATGLSKVKALTEKANGEGLTVRDVNNLARMHGQDLNGFNANGELASGLTKQAAENTRVGLKDSVKNTIQDPIIKAQFEALDSKMSDTFTVKDLSGKMADKVNTLTQRLQQPNILQKIGGFIGKYGRYTGVGDLMQKLLGLEKTPGATTLNAVELEAKLSKNLAKIDAALKKNDAGFASDIKTMLNEKPQGQ